MAVENAAEVFSKYLSSRKVLIVDPSATSRSNVFALFQDLGSKTSQMTLVNNFNQADAAILSVKPHIVLTEFDLGKRCGLDLLQCQRAQRPTETRETLFVIMTSNTSQAAVARSAEEDIDSYIIKPFTPEVVRSTLLMAAIAKIKPSTYRQTIEEGKAALLAMDLPKAEAAFQQATQLDSSPALALGYLAQVKHMRKLVTEAKGSYGSGLKYNRIHYKCMVGMYDLLMAERDTAGAYEIVRRMSQYFPANPKRLGEVLRLAIINRKYEDIEQYYLLFTKLDVRSEELCKYIFAALIVCGKYYLGQGETKKRALELFGRAVTVGAGKSSSLREIISALVEHRLYKDAAPYLDRYPPAEMGTPEYLALQFLVKFGEVAPSLVISQGRALIAKNVHDQRVYSVLLRHAIENRMTAYAEELMLNACGKFPEAKRVFEEIVKNTKPITKSE